MPIDSNESLVPIDYQPVQLPVKKLKPVKDPLITINETKKNLRRVGMDPDNAPNWKAKAGIGRFIGQQGADEIALVYLMDNCNLMKRLIKQSEDILAKPHTEIEGARADRAIINCVAELNKACERIQTYKKLVPVDHNTSAPKAAGPPPRSSVTAQQVNVFVGKKDVPHP